ncbi:hypothetical protein CL1_1088 [Thermococcus cleftensis]|uniref:DUF835 domain-containing protein n=1 Tax=Thermococcus cleftensis (strain DSM 27260 / KACC 17922 / CL1) TaxID=163003 RepID=I3ZUA7_THECF|nr:MULTISPECIES: DUF835 domain-containing protein [Thermococcus]AFL95291.1 hypothetical protein CL1_1088 [Thermococcus cleftensis]NJE04250.1 DUF835 domain-containing protein [Thermococcus sp. MV11]
MGLTVPHVVLLADIVLFLVISYAAVYAIKRIHRYGEPLDRFIIIIAASLFLAAAGRLLDVIDDVTEPDPVIFSAEQVLYFFSIIGVAYGLLSYISSVERRILPAPVKGVGSDDLSPGGYLYTGEGEVQELIASVKAPVLVVTRSPWKYKEFENVQTLWVTQAGEEGVGPTRLHVILEAAVSFMRGGGRLVIIDCLEVLILYNDFSSVFRFLSTLKDYAVSSRSTLLLLVGRDTLREREFKLLAREFQPIKNLREILRTSS